MSDYKISIKCQDGTAWLRGRVANEEQMNRALKVVFQTPRRYSRCQRIDPWRQPPPSKCSPWRPSRWPRWPPKRQPHKTPRRRVIPFATKMAQTSRSPQRDGLVKRLESVFSRNSGQDSGKAERVSSSYRSAPVETVSAQEVQEEVPQQMNETQRARPMANRMAMQSTVRGPVAANGAPLPMYTAAASRGNAAPARYDQPCMPNYCLAKLRSLSELRGCDLSQAVFADGLAIHRTILSISASSDGLAKSDLGMGRRLVVPRLQGSTCELLASVVQ